jgi:hypothetical protein
MHLFSGSAQNKLKIIIFMVFWADWDRSHIKMYEANADQAKAPMKTANLKCLRKFCIFFFYIEHNLRITSAGGFRTISAQYFQP